MVDGSNKSLFRPDEESDPILRKGIPLHKSFQKADVLTTICTVAQSAFTSVINQDTVRSQTLSYTEKSILPSSG